MVEFILTVPLLPELLLAQGQLAFQLLLTQAEVGILRLERALLVLEQLGTALIDVDFLRNVLVLVLPLLEFLLDLVQVVLLVPLEQTALLLRRLRTTHLPA